MNAQFVIESGIPIPALPPKRSQGPNRLAIEATLGAMKKGDSFLISSPHLKGEVKVIAADLDLEIHIKPGDKANTWRCWLVGDPLPEDPNRPKPLPPEQTSPNPRRLESEITAYLERQGLVPDYGQNTIRFHHLQKPSRRILTLHQLKDGEVRLSFAHALPEFEERWSLSATGELPLNFVTEEVWEALDDFFEIVHSDPPPGSLPFEERLREVDDIIKRIANKHKRAGNYELTYEDLVSIETQKTHEVYLRFGDKPTYDWQSLVKVSIENKCRSLLSKHFESKCRGPVEREGPDGPERVDRTTALTDEMIEVLPATPLEETAMPADEVEVALDSVANPVERLLLKSLVRPTKSLQVEQALDELRYQRIKDQHPKARLLPPKKYTLEKLALSTSKSENELKLALDRLIEKNPTEAWEDLIESLNG